MLIVVALIPFEVLAFVLALLAAALADKLVFVGLPLLNFLR